MVYSCKIVKSESVRCSVWLFETPWTVASQAPLFVEFSRQEYWSSHWLGSHSLQGNLPDPGTKPRLPGLQADSTPSEPSGKPIIVKKSPSFIEHVHHLLSSFIIHLWIYHSFVELIQFFYYWYLTHTKILVQRYWIILFTLQLLSHFSRVRLLCDPIDGSPPGSTVLGILQARTLEWVAIHTSELCSNITFSK